MKPITFCIATTGDEKEYLALALKSLREHTQIENHEVLVFIDNGTHDTLDYLRELQKDFPQMRVCLNDKSFGIGLQRNMSVMIQAATNDVVCYLQSDMVVGKDLDVHINNNLTDEKTILSFARIEPPLHPKSNDKITLDLGIRPDIFKWDEFNATVESIQSEHRPVINAHFAPFAIYKSAWIEIGGFDAQFVCSREDSDFNVRAKLHGMNLIQSWDTIVYHFTCISSRGKDWYDNSKESEYTNRLQMMADQQEVLRFIRKWGRFGHDIEYRYETRIEIEMDIVADFNVLLSIEPYFDWVRISDPLVANQLRNIVEFNAQYFTKLRRKMTDADWVRYVIQGKFYGGFSTGTRILGYDSGPEHGTVVKMKFSDYMNHGDATVIQNIQDLIHQNEIGEYQTGPFTINIYDKDNLVDSTLKSSHSGVYYDEIIKFHNYIFD